LTGVGDGRCAQPVSASVLICKWCMFVVEVSIDAESASAFSKLDMEDEDGDVHAIDWDGSSAWVVIGPPRGSVCITALL